MAHTVHTKAIGDRLITVLNADASVAALGFVGDVGWATDAYKEPVYPIAPVTDLPSAKLREYTDDITPGPTGGHTTFSAKFSLWVKRRQTAGQAHQNLLQADLETIVNALVGAWRPATVIAESGVTIFGVYIRSVVIHDTLRHEFDDPRLRVSVGEIHFEVSYRAVG